MSQWYHRFFNACIEKGIEKLVEAPGNTELKLHLGVSFKHKFVAIHRVSKQG